MSSTTSRLVTAHELLALPDDGYRYELVKGELIRMSLAGSEHGVVTMNLAGPLHSYVKRNNLGRVYAAETGFKLESDPDTVRAPDIAFVGRAPGFGSETEITGYRDGAPDLAVEVLSPNDRLRKVEAKVRQWLDTGAQMAWVVDPQRRTVTVYRSPDQIDVLTEKDNLSGDDVVPGFEIHVADIFL